MRILRLVRNGAAKSKKCAEGCYVLCLRNKQKGFPDKVKTPLNSEARVNIHVRIRTFNIIEFSEEVVL